MIGKIDMRSDTATIPTDLMIKEMNNTTFGDAMLEEDSTVRELEELASSIFGMEDAMLTISGTMSNHIAIMALTNRGEEVILGRDSHIYNLSVGALSTLSQVQPRVISVKDNRYDLEEMEASIQSGATIQETRTGLICVENTYNLNTGIVIPLDNLKEIYNLGQKHQIPIFMDGARIFNAISHLEIEPKEIGKYVDAMQFCLTKGLGCPLGSILLGSKSFIKRAKSMRQRLGGGMHQAGIIASAGVVGLKYMMDRVEEDNQRARQLATLLSDISGIKVLVDEVQSNIVPIEISLVDWDAERLIRELNDKNIYVKKIGEKQMRIVTHYGINDKDIEYVYHSMKHILHG